VKPRGHGWMGSITRIGGGEDGRGGKTEHHAPGIHAKREWTPIEIEQELAHCKFKERGNENQGAFSIFFSFFVYIFYCVYLLFLKFFVTALSLSLFFLFLYFVFCFVIKDIKNWFANHFVLFERMYVWMIAPHHRLDRLGFEDLLKRSQLVELYQQKEKERTTNKKLKKEKKKIRKERRGRRRSKEVNENGAPPPPAPPPPPRKNQLQIFKSSMKKAIHQHVRIYSYNLFL
jgi:hypothetical protein